MVLAYLRGLLPKEPAYGLRSSLAEDLIIESLLAEVNVQHYECSVLADSAALPILTDKSKNEVMKSTNARLARAMELRTMDIYRLGSVQAPAPKNEISLYQLYQLALNNGILSALANHNAKESQ